MTMREALNVLMDGPLWYRFTVKERLREARWLVFVINQEDMIYE